MTLYAIDLILEKLISLFMIKRYTICHELGKG